MPKFSVPKQNDKFLWVRFGGLGDILQALADAYYVKQKFPQIHISFLAPPRYIDIVTSQPYIEEFISGYKKPLSRMLETAHIIREKKFDWVASTHKGTHATVMLYLTGIKHRLGCSHYVQFLNTDNIYSWTQAHGINLRKRPEKALFAPADSTAYAKELLKPLDGKKKIFCLIGAGTANKRWPTKYWIELLKPLISDGWGAVLNGYGSEENDIANEIARALNSESVLNAVGKVDFIKMLGVASECQAAIGNDTGTLHLAALCGVPTVGIFDYIQPVDVGYNMPWLTFAVARQKNVRTLYTKTRNADVLAELKPEIVREKFDKLVGMWVK